MPAVISCKSVTKVYPGGLRALDGLSFSVQPGGSLALIGDNGAGKTTALRIISRLTHPSSGRVEVRGRVAALLDVASGLHPDLTGRENVHLYSRILGIDRATVRRRFEEVVEFADIGTALDEQVRTYSAGQQLRLGFAISAHVDPDVLVVDEVIAVGDVTFQDRCARRLRELRSSGCALILASHLLPTVESLCERAIRLDAGRAVDEGPPAEVVDRYLADGDRVHAGRAGGPFIGDGLLIASVAFHGEAGEPEATVRTGEPITIRIAYETTARIPAPKFSIGIFDRHYGCVYMATMLSEQAASTDLDGSGIVECALAGLPLRPRTYEVWVSVRDAEGVIELIPWQPMADLILVDGRGDGAPAPRRAWESPLDIPHEWRHP